MTENGPLLELRNVTKRYDAPGGGPGVTVLEGVCLTLPAGGRLTVTGPSGSGKSTLLNLIGALDRPTEGAVTLAGQDLAAQNDRRLATLRNVEVGFVFQLHHLLPQCSVWENVLIPTLPRGGPGEQTSDRARRLLERVGLAERLEHRPGQLSGGERQRVALVRALVNGPRLLLADEPTGSLDRTAADGLAALLGELNEEEGVALIVATHSMRLAGQVGNVRALRDGRLGEPGESGPAPQEPAG